MAKKKNKTFWFYRFIRFFAKPFFKLWYNPKLINAHYLRDAEGSIIVAGNHKHTMDQCGAMMATKRVIRYMAKIEYFNGEAALLGKGNKFTFWLSKKIVMAGGCIPVDRNKKDEDAKDAAIEVLNDGGMLGLFPEGTRNKTDAFMLPFKFGTVSLAQKTGAAIVPFGIMGEYKFRSKDLRVRFGEPFKVPADMPLDEANDQLFLIIRTLMEKNLEEEKD